ncbi:hypothetical protein [Halosegnis longus]|uniref:hypothetical protein n=1 Tax=Halosegnis longus TaxID=2216012 RepID=UPI00129E275D|nr:hypothetical protein [Halosegnis longus]
MPTVQTIDPEFNFTGTGRFSWLTDEQADEARDVSTGQDRTDVGVTPIEDLEDAFGLTKIKLERTYAAGGSTCELTGHVPYETNTGFLKQATQPDAHLYLELDLRVTTDSEEQTSGRLFTGEMTKATLNEEQLLTLTFTDKRYQLNQYGVELNTKKGDATVDTIVRNILRDAGFFPNDDFVINISDPVTVNSNYGKDGKATLINVLRDLAEQQDAMLWIDEYNTIHFVDQQSREKEVYMPMGIISYNAGQGTADTNSVIVNTPHDDTGLNPWGATTREMSQGSASVKPDNQPEATGKKLTDNNVSAIGAQNRAQNRLATQQMATDSGELEIVGDPRITPLDQIQIVDPPVASPIGPGTYTAKRVTHKISASNGYTMNISLGKDIEQIFQSIYNQSDVNKQEPKEGSLWSKLNPRKFKLNANPFTFAPIEFGERLVNENMRNLRKSYQLSTGNFEAFDDEDDDDSDTNS